ncbi:MAG TPA: chromosome segregation protein SMC [Candidatus Nanoarchaeia archaeon]|nr:chromosome segregation protein SMC [Candidatus Nanoarchaeia archaeon]
MTKINRITIQGFKSFAHKTEIQFNDQFNCILGPNGSGKSNIGDALCFVLGRISAKSLRAEKTANLIFNGGKSKQPAASGAVEIAFSNEKKSFPVNEPEVMVSRVISKDGSSSYRVNGKKKTRTEVVDLLSLAKVNPEGYNIILQGDITRFVDMSPLERRKIIEEISDVSVYEDKKHKSILELNKVEEKLNNAEIILKERSTYLKELKKDRDQALKFKELKEKINSYKATYIHLQITELESANAVHLAELEKSQQKIRASEEKINGLKDKISSAKSETSLMNAEIEQKGEKGQVKVHKEIEDLKISITKKKARISTLRDEINKIRQRKDQFNMELKELLAKNSAYGQQQKEWQNSLFKKSKELQDLEQNIASFKNKHNLESSKELDSQIEGKDKLIELKQEEVQVVRQKQQELLREKDRIEYQVQTINEKIKKVKEVGEQNKGQIKVLQEHKQNFKSAALKLSQCLDADSSYASQLGNARRSLQLQQEAQDRLQAKNRSIQAQLASNQAVMSILENKRQFAGVYGTVAELGQANKKYSVALEMSAGAKMQQIVVDDDQTAAECIKYLKDNKSGSASFIPLNKIRIQPISVEDHKLLKSAGVHDFAINLVSFKLQFKTAFQYVFGNSLVVDNLSTARKIGIGRIKMTTLEGDISEASGVMRGGFINKKIGLGFKEKDSLEELEQAGRAISELQSVIANIEDKRRINEQEISSLRNKKAELEAEMIKLEKTLHLESSDLEASSELLEALKNRLKEVDGELSYVQREITAINKGLAALKTEKQLLRTEITELRNPRLLAQLQAFEESRQKCREEIVQLESELRSGSAQLQQLILPEREKIAGIMKQQEKEEASFNEEIGGLNHNVTKEEEVLKGKEKASMEFYSKYRALFAQREKLTTEINRSENDLENCRERMRSNERELNLFSLKNAEIKAKLAGLQEEFNRLGEALILKNKAAAELKQEMSRYELMMAQMSAVNMKALEVYEQVEAEFNKLLEKKGSLYQEKTDVLTLMNEIETKKKEHFMKTFSQANHNFTKIFSTLFSKGNAYLQLDNHEKPFEDGLSIKVKLTGNRYMDIKSLSGGEKTLTALSFIFAIQEYQPASFYILDEIDAALDKHNAERLSKLIRGYSNKAQYVVISHNDALIAEADTLFGISMKDGVSKVTSLKI